MKCPLNKGSYCWACEDEQYRQCLTRSHTDQMVKEKMAYDRLGPTSVNQPDEITRNWDYIYSKEHYTEEGYLL